MADFSCDCVPNSRWQEDSWTVCVYLSLRSARIDVSSPMYVWEGSFVRLVMNA